MKNNLSKIFKNKYFQTIAATAVLLLIWQAAAAAVGERILIASPAAVLARLAVIWREDGFFGAIAFTLLKIVHGFLLGLFCGALLAVAAGRFSVIEILLNPFMITVKSVPVASFIVIALIWLSSSELSVFISFLIVLPVVYSNVLGGIKSIPKSMSDMAAVFKIPTWRRIVYIWLPGIKPYLLSACAAALGMSWKAGVAAEIIGLPRGSLGEALYEAKVYFNTVDLFSWTVVIVLVSVIFEKLFMAALRFCFSRLERL